MGKIRHPGEDLFFEAVMSLKTQEDCRLFFEDICTIKELQSLYQRFRVACLLDESAFAGSIATAPVLLRTALEVGVTLPDAVNMMSRNPARLLGLRKGELTEGFDADVTVLSNDLTVMAVFVGGEQVV